MLNKIKLENVKHTDGKVEFSDNYLSRMSILNEDDDSRCSFLHEERASIRIEEGVDTTRRSLTAFLFKRTDTPTTVGKFDTAAEYFVYGDNDDYKVSIFCLLLYLFFIFIFRMVLEVK